MKDEMKKQMSSMLQERESLVSHDSQCIYIHFSDSADPYTILRNECNSCEMLSSWAQQLLSKEWMTKELVMIFQAKAAELFDPHTSVVL